MTLRSASAEAAKSRRCSAWRPRSYIATASWYVGLRGGGGAGAGGGGGGGAALTGLAATFATGLAAGLALATAFAAGLGAGLRLAGLFDPGCRGFAGGRARPRGGGRGR